MMSSDKATAQAKAKAKAKAGGTARSAGGGTGGGDTGGGGGGSGGGSGGQDSQATLILEEVGRELDVFKCLTALVPGCEEALVSLAKRLQEKKNKMAKKKNNVARPLWTCSTRFRARRYI